MIELIYVTECKRTCIYIPYVICIYNIYIYDVYDVYLFNRYILVNNNNEYDILNTNMILQKKI